MCTNVPHVCILCSLLICAEEASRPKRVHSDQYNRCYRQLTLHYSQSHPAHPEHRLFPTAHPPLPPNRGAAGIGSHSPDTTHCTAAVEVELYAGDVVQTLQRVPRTRGWEPHVAVGCRQPLSLQKPVRDASSRTVDITARKGTEKGNDTSTRTHTLARAKADTTSNASMCALRS